MSLKEVDTVPVQLTAELKEDENEPERSAASQTPPPSSPLDAIGAALGAVGTAIGVASPGQMVVATPSSPPVFNVAVGVPVPVWLRPAPASPPFARRKPLTKASPPSSTARNTSPKPTPSERAEKDAARIKARVAKRWASPGPGQYNPQKLGSNVLSLAGSSAFRSKSQRPSVDPFLRESGDPGTYMVTDVASVALQAMESYNRQSFSGHSGFGTVSERQLYLEAKDSTTPGPVDYSPLMPRTLGDTERASDAAGGRFRSESPQRRPLLPNDAPGVGTYDPNMDSVEPLVPSAGCCMVTGRDTRFAGQTLPNDGRETGPGVGPGTYNDDRTGTIAQSASQIRDRMSRHAHMFGSKGSRVLLPFESYAERQSLEVPGPGAYETMRYQLADDGHRSSFRTATVRMAPEAAIGDPGAYDLSKVSTIAAQAAMTHNRAGRAGTAGFGPQTARELPLRILGEDTPAPGSYFQHWTTDIIEGSIFEMPNHAFRSGSMQRPLLLPSASPGIGAYHLNMDSVEPLVPNAGALMVTGRDSRFAGQTLPNDGRETGPGVGPGTYNDEKHDSIAQIAEKTLEAMSRGFVDKSASFGTGTPARPIDLSHDRERQEAPGPGMYNPSTFGDIATRMKAASNFNARSRAGMEAFGAKTARENRSDARNMDAIDMGDPGAYDPRMRPSGDGHSVAQVAAHSFHRASRAGQSAFGSQSARVMRQDVVLGDNTPGPSEYCPTTTNLGFQRPLGDPSTPSRATSVFRSGSTQRPPLLPNDSPGVGDYYPNMDSVDPLVPNGGVAKTGRSTRFAGQTLPGDGRMTGPQVGPGTYEPELKMDGERATISQSVKDRADQGWSWNFIGDSVRTWFANTFSIEISQALQF